MDLQFEILEKQQRLNKLTNGLNKAASDRQVILACFEYISSILPSKPTNAFLTFHLLYGQFTCEEYNVKSTT